MNHSVDRDTALTSEQLMIVSALVGAAIAREDRPALEAAYRDFRAGMDELKSAFEHLTGSPDQAGSPGRAGATHPEVRP